MIEIIWSPFLIRRLNLFLLFHITQLITLNYYLNWTAIIFSNLCLHFFVFSPIPTYWCLLGLPRFFMTLISFLATVYWSMDALLLKLGQSGYFFMWKWFIGLCMDPLSDYVIRIISRISWNVIEKESKSLSPGGKFKKSWQLFFLLSATSQFAARRKKSDT